MQSLPDANPTEPTTTEPTGEPVAGEPTAAEPSRWVADPAAPGPDAGAPDAAAPRPFAPQPGPQPLGPPPQGPRPLDPAARPRELRRSRDRKLAGVCGGLAEYFGIDPVIVRLLFFGGLFMGAATLPVYIAAWIVMPDTAALRQPPVVTDHRFAA